MSRPDGSEKMGRIELLADLPEQHWQEASTPELLEQIKEKFHTHLRTELPEIKYYANLIRKVHGSNHPELTEVHAIFSGVNQKVEELLAREEEILYPAIARYSESKTEPDRLEAVKIIAEIEEGYRQIVASMKGLRAVTGDYHLPEDACEAFTTTYHKLQAVEGVLGKHIHIESDILFPRIKSIEDN